MAGGVNMVNSMMGRGGIGVAFVGALLCAIGTVPAYAHECNGTDFSSTFELIQHAIFENHGCSQNACHGAAMSGGMDLREGAAYASIVDVEAQTVAGFKRVVPGQKEQSLLWINVAAKAFPDRYDAPLRAMPPGGLPALSANEVEALRIWIEQGAPETGVIEGTGDLLDACLPPPEPVPIKPLPPPPPGEGVQIKMPRWVLEPHSEHEVCFASYYDVTDQVPAGFRGPDGTTFRYNFNQIRQDALSHHLIVSLYKGRTPLSDPVWGEFKCQGGASDGESCDPTDLNACGEDGGCATDPVDSVACIGFGPPDAGLGLSSSGFVATQEAGAEFHFADGVFRELPLKGVLLWDSHAFNLSDTSGKLEAWLNFGFAPPEEQRSIAQQIFNTDAIFDTDAPPFGTDEVCHVHELPRHAHLFELTSHMHKRGKRFRVYEGEWTCGGAAGGVPCSPLGYDGTSPDPCPGACTSTTRAPAGDCDLNDTVTVSELITAVNIALGNAALATCEDADVDGDGEIAVNELVTAVNAALNGVPAPTRRDPVDSLLYESRLYNDPVVAAFDPPMVFDSPVPSARSLTYCAMYDNGFTDPNEVKRRSTSPPNSLFLCTPTHCAEGRVGEPCTGVSDVQRDASCDTDVGADDGRCDACRLKGGVTSDDEMFILLGQYFLP